MALNPWLVPTLLLGYLAFGAATGIWARAASGSQRATIFTVAMVVALPGFLFDFYYLHLMDNAMWFYEFRSRPGTELTAAGLGLMAGFLAKGLERRRFGSRVFLLLLLTLALAVPYLKPLLLPLNYEQLQNRWKDGVCLQSAESSCGPASAATLLKAMGIQATEQELAKECFTSRSGTENWYLARALRRRGLEVRFMRRQSSDMPAPVPCIAGVKVEQAGHFVPIIPINNGRYLTGDPLAGRAEWTREELERAFRFTGLFMTVKRR